MSRRLSALASMLAYAFCAPAFAEQYIQIGDYQAHYMILDTLSLEPHIADTYSVSRARNQSLLTISVLNSEAASVPVEISGQAINLLGIQRPLDFRLITADRAHYSIASITHTEEVMRFELRIKTPDGREQPVEFRQKLYLGLE